MKTILTTVCGNCHSRGGGGGSGELWCLAWPLSTPGNVTSECCCFALSLRCFFGGGEGWCRGGRLTTSGSERIYRQTERQRVCLPASLCSSASSHTWFHRRCPIILPKYVRKNKRKAPICQPVPVPVITLPFCRNTSVCLTVLLLHAGTQQEVLPPKQQTVLIMIHNGFTPTASLKHNRYYQHRSL